ncbi:MAG TPA: type II secretion system F family protein [Longimicrobium sp.]|nr:type II secretion system F family protein [Longimicrobium sp.]
MPAFAYRAANAAGRTVRGVEEAESAPALERQLGARGLYPLHVAPATAADAEPRRAGFRGRRADVVEAIRYLVTLLDAGFPLDRALAAVSRVVARNDVAQAISDARERVRGGARLEQAMAAHPRIFPRFAVGMVRAGERGGQLAPALDRLAAQLEREQALRSRLASAMVYPAVMMAVGAGALVVLFVYVLPRFVALLADTGSALPKSTAALLAAGAFVSRWWVAIVIALVALVGGIAAWRATEEGRAATDRILLGVPVIGGLRRRVAAARLGRSLSTLLASGLPILPALEVAAESQADAAVAAEVLRAREEVRAGDRLAASLRRTGIFPFVFVQMVDVGEEGGRLPEMLDRGATAMEGELERRLDRMLRLLEPLLIVVFGGIVGFVALSLLQAIYGIRADAF